MEVLDGEADHFKRGIVISVIDLHVNLLQFLHLLRNRGEGSSDRA